MSEKYNFSGCWELSSLSNAEKYFEIAKSYINASYTLCQAMLEGSYKHNWPNPLVVLSLAHHSHELFFKGAILNTGQQVPKTHNIGKLLKAYNNLYPDPKYHIDSLFLVTDFTENKNKENEMYGTMDQSYRYLHDNKGDPWDGIQSFNASIFHNELVQYILKTEKIIPLILKK